MSLKYVKAAANTVIFKLVLSKIKTALVNTKNLQKPIQTTITITALGRFKAQVNLKIKLIISWYK